MNAYAEAREITNIYFFVTVIIIMFLTWLGKRFFERAEWFKINKPSIFKNNYNGEVARLTGGTIFENLEVREINR